MTTQIVIHLLPQEIDWFEWQIKQLKQGSYYLEEDDKVIIDVTLNLNLVDWSQSQLPKQFFIDKFFQIEKLCDWCETQFIIDEENKCLGCNDKRREAIHSTEADNILYLDSDLIFRSELLSYIIQAPKLIKDPYYIISPQTIRMWDDSWDVIVNKNHLNTPAYREIYNNADPFKYILNFGDNIHVVPINQFKFGGGWFNLISTKLLKLTDIPLSLGSYGVDDTYVMICCDSMKKNGMNVQQYVLDGTTVVENYKYRWNPYNNYLFIIDKQNEFRENSQKYLLIEVQNFINKNIKK
jgi:hypothetical protein